MGHLIIWASDALSIIPFASFAWGARGHFICPGPMPRAMQALLVFSGLAYASFLLVPLGRAGTSPFTAIIAGQMLFCLATMVFWWAVGATSTTRLRIAYQGGDATDIVSNGPFALVRHPFYLAYMLFWTGTGLVAGTWQWLPVLMLIVWYVLIARSEERRLARPGPGASYDAYRRRTGMFLPSLRRQ